MVGQNQPHFSSLGLSQQRFEFADRLQFNIDVFSLRQESEQKGATFFEGKISSTAFARIARRNNERNAKSRDLLFIARADWRQRIETKFEKIGQLSDCKGMPEIGLRGNDGHQPGPAYFTGSARCHIIAGSVSGERWVALF